MYRDFIFYDVSRFIEFKLWRRVRRWMRAVHPLPVIGGLAAAALFSTTPQLFEIYAGLAEGDRGPAFALKLALAIAALSILSGAIYVSHYWLTKVQLDELYAESGRLDTDLELRIVRNWTGALSALAPWIGLAAGLAIAAGHMRDNAATLAALALGARQIAKHQAEIAKLAPVLFTAFWVAALAGFAIVGLLHVSRRTRALQWGTSGAVGLTLLILIALPLLLNWLPGGLKARFEDLVPPVTVFREIGPLAMIALVAAGLYAVFALMALLSSQIGFPLIPLTLLIGTVAVLLKLPIDSIARALAGALVVTAILGWLSNRYALVALSITLALLSWALSRQLTGAVASRPPPPPLHRAHAVDATLEAEFVRWLGDRQPAPARSGSRPYPVLIIAAQGGGLYAATAAEAFLAALQARCPAFAQHVFAISAVSGGALGSALFQAGTPLPALNTASGCTARTRADDTANQHAQSSKTSNDPVDVTPPVTAAARALRDDHLSPLLGFLLADLFGAYDDRSRALETSFTTSAKRESVLLGERMDSSFDLHWRPDSPRPSLVLNATWVETGNRVAFAPFAMAGIGDGTVLSAQDIALGRDMALSRAVTVSARFPGIVPAYRHQKPIVTGKTKPKPSAPAFWHFVDGGYADASGAATAHDIYSALKEIIERRKLAVDLRLVLLTGTEASTDYGDLEGNPARDTLAPFIALIKVRDLLARQAVARARVGLGETGGAGLMDWKVKPIELDADTFHLPLGWTLSKTTHRLVATLVAPPDICPEPRPTGEAFALLPAIVRNACAIDDIATLLTP